MAGTRGKSRAARARRARASGAPPAMKRDSDTDVSHPSTPKPDVDGKAKNKQTGHCANVPCREDIAAGPASQSSTSDNVVRQRHKKIVRTDKQCEGTSRDELTEQAAPGAPRPAAKSSDDKSAAARQPVAESARGIEDSSPTEANQPPPDGSKPAPSKAKDSGALVVAGAKAGRSQTRESREEKIDALILQLEAIPERVREIGGPPVTIGQINIDVANVSSWLETLRKQSC